MRSRRKSTKKPSSIPAKAEEPSFRRRTNCATRSSKTSIRRSYGISTSFIFPTVTIGPAATPTAASISSRAIFYRRSICLATVRSKARTEADSSSANWKTTYRTSTTSSCRGSRIKTTFTNRSRIFWERASSQIMSITVQSRRQSLTPELARLNREIEVHAREYGLDFYETFFEILDFEEMNMVAAYGGFPNRYPHWKFGMEYERLNKSYAYGLHKIYEMVINNDPCYAYLLECNHLVDQKIVMAHVYGHCDFFKNNIWFSKTNRKMMDTMANHATKIRKYIDKFGLDVVESFLDLCLSIDDLIDHHSVFIESSGRPSANSEEAPPVVRKISSSDYMDGFINPP